MRGFFCVKIICSSVFIDSLLILIYERKFDVIYLIISCINDKYAKGHNMNLQDLIANFTTTPFLFIGSGMTRRYLGLPNWEGLLRHFAKEVSNNEFAYNSYVNKVQSSGNSINVMPKVATLIEKDFNAIISNTIKKNRKYCRYNSVDEIWKAEHDDIGKATELLSYLTEDQIDVDKLGQVLKEIFDNDRNILQDSKSLVRTNIRRLIRIYDCLKWRR